MTAYESSCIPFGTCYNGQWFRFNNTVYIAQFSTAIGIGHTDENYLFTPCPAFNSRFDADTLVSIVDNTCITLPLR